MKTNKNFNKKIYEMALKNQKDYSKDTTPSGDDQSGGTTPDVIPTQKTILNVYLRNNNTSAVISETQVKVDKYSLTTDEQGKCSFTHLTANKTYDISVSCNGYDEYKESITIEKGETDYIVYMIPIQDADTIRLTGMVQDGQGPLKGVSVENQSGDEKTTTNVNGYYALDIPKSNLPDNTIYVNLNKQFYDDLPFNVTISGDKNYYEIEDKTLTLPSGLGETSSVKGKAEYPDYEVPTIMYGAGNVDMLLLNPLSGKMYSCATLETGEFEKSNIAPGWYDVKLEGNSDYLNQTFSNAFFLRPVETLEDVKLELIRTTHDFRLSVVYSDSGNFITNTKVEIFTDENTTNMIASGTTSELGKMNFVVSNSIEQLWAKIYISDTDVRTVSLGSAKTTATKVKL